MTETRYRIIFSGHARFGATVDELKERLQEHLKMKPEQVEELFDHAPIAIRSGLNEEETAEFMQFLESLGAEVESEEMRQVLKASPVGWVVRTLLVLVAAGFGYLAYQTQSDHNHARKAVGVLSTKHQDVERQSERGHYAQARYKWDKIETEEWQKVIKRVREAPTVLSGSGQLSVFRIKALNPEVDTFELKGSGLRLLDKRGAKRLRSVSNGAFVIYDHRRSDERKSDRDLLTVGSLQTGRVNLLLEVPARGTVTVLGDLEIWLPDDVEMGHLSVTLNTNDLAESGSETRLAIGALQPVRGRKLAFDSEGEARLGPIAPGTYRVRLIGLEGYKDDLKIHVDPAKETRIKLDLQPDNKVDVTYLNN